MQVVVKAKYYIHTYGLGSITWEKRLQYVWWTINQGQAEHYVIINHRRAKKHDKTSKVEKRTTDFQREEALQNININRRLCKYVVTWFLLNSRSLSALALVLQNKADKWVNWRTATFSSPLASFSFFSLSPIYASLVGQQPKTKNLSLSVGAWAWWIAFLGWIM